MNKKKKIFPQTENIINLTGNGGKCPPSNQPTRIPKRRNDKCKMIRIKNKNFNFDINKPDE